MAQIINCELTMVSEPGTVYAKIVTRIAFTPREVRENLEYGVNIRLLRHTSGATVIPTGNGHEAGELFVIPPSGVGTLIAGQIIKVQPTARPVEIGVNLSVDPAAVPTGTQLKVAALIRPEITGGLYFSRIDAMP